MKDKENIDETGLLCLCLLNKKIYTGGRFSYLFLRLATYMCCHKDILDSSVLSKYTKYQIWLNTLNRLCFFYIKMQTLCSNMVEPLPGSGTIKQPMF